MDTEKKPDEQKTDQPKQDIGEIVGDLVVSGATLLAHSAAETVVKHVKKVAAKSAPVEAVKKVVKKAKKSAAGTKAAKTKKAKKASKKSGPKKSTGKKAAKKSSKKTTRKKTKNESDAEGCMSSKHFGRLAARFKKASGSSGLRFQAAIKDCCFFAEAPSRIEVVVTRPRSGRDDLHRLDDHSIVDH